ncbi:hypothetical protein [Pseudomonas sp. St290]|uniref:hypothetical protein n=1 Tax=Pseudomonas sp. St290 TaxID=1602166 RepID=UPI0013C35355|nr:hypothetical protein [Pseudomonas sp. St290]BBH31961.1 hypothetical protein PBDP_1498 [Pseudomonas sp. St290]
MSYFDMLYEMQASYGEATNNKGLTIYQAFAYAYDEMDALLHSKAYRVRIQAFTALFFVAIREGVTFARNDPFTDDVFEELSDAYSKLSELGLGSGSDEDDKLMLEHVRLVASFTGVINF